jgi:hypothetical protein
MIRSSHFRPARKRRAALAVAALAMMAGVVAAVPASATTGWVVQTTANPAGSTLDELAAVSCTSASNCIAVGNEENSAGNLVALAERWNGSTWALQTAVNPSGGTGVSLDGVSCPSATYCIAVGENDTATTLTAVAESWNGSTWTLQSPVNPARAFLSGVSCTATNNCEAVGADSAGPLAEHWNGSTWAAQTVPAAAGRLGSVSCVSATFCEAVSIGAAASWNGSTWTAKTLQPGTIFSVSCVSASSCEAVGYLLVDQEANTLVEHWNGSTWADQTVSGSSDPALYGVSCASATSCTAAGVADNPNGTGYGVTAAEFWNGSTWTQQTTPNPSGAEDANFQAISCPTTAACTAVGDWYAASPSLTRTLGEQN